jgi:amino acid permease
MRISYIILKIIAFLLMLSRDEMAVFMQITESFCTLLADLWADAFGSPDIDFLAE